MKQIDKAWMSIISVQLFSFLRCAHMTQRVTDQLNRGMVFHWRSRHIPLVQIGNTIFDDEQITDRL